jgi:hypothetical protein
MKKLRLVAALGLGLLLTACGSEPSESDISTLFKTELDKQMAMIPIASMRVEFHGLKKESCAKAGEIWQCVITIDATQPMLGRNSRTSTVSLIKGDHGWQVVQ